MTNQSSTSAKALSRSPVLADELGARVTAIGTYGLYIALAVIYFWFGGMKFTAYEAKGLASLVEPSPVIGWMYGVFSVQGFSYFLGTLEIVIGLLILGRFLSPKLSVFGGLLSCGLFLTTVSLMLSTKGVFEPSLGFPAISVMPGQFLLKDIGLLAASVLVFGESLSAVARQSGSIDADRASRAV